MVLWLPQLKLLSKLILISAMLSTEKHLIKVLNDIRINHNSGINFAGVGFKQWNLQDKEFVQTIDNFHLVTRWRCTAAIP